MTAGGEGVLIAPAGGSLVDLRASAEERPALGAGAAGLPPLRLSDGAVCDCPRLAGSGTGGG